LDTNANPEPFAKFPYGACGLYCAACGTLDCGGCGSDYVDGYSLKCKFRNCTREKKVEFCSECEEYPCRELETFMHDEWPHHRSAKANLEFIKAHGKQKWLEEQKKLWTCTNCNRRIFWYQNACSCNTKLDAWELPANIQ
jgi:hypothetical protein